MDFGKWVVANCLEAGRSSGKRKKQRGTGAITASQQNLAPSLDFGAPHRCAMDAAAGHEPPHHAVDMSPALLLPLTSINAIADHARLDWCRPSVFPVVKGLEMAPLGRLFDDPGCSDLLPPFPVLGHAVFFLRDSLPPPWNPVPVKSCPLPAAVFREFHGRGVHCRLRDVLSLSCFECGEAREPANHFSRRSACFIFTSRMKSNLKMNQLLKHPLETI
jgi:hypothetical protein